MTPNLRLRPAGGLPVLFWLLLGAWSAASELPENSLLLEAEGFGDRSGWVVDTQSMDVMGSPYALAHGLGSPVEDAATVADAPADGSHRCFRSTRWQ